MLADLWSLKFLPKAEGAMGALSAKTWLSLLGMRVENGGLSSDAGERAAEKHRHIAMEGERPHSHQISVSKPEQNSNSLLHVLVVPL